MPKLQMTYRLMKLNKNDQPTNPKQYYFTAIGRQLLMLVGADKKRGGTAQTRVNRTRPYQQNICVRRKE
jgi:hypothetical protein